MELQHEAARGTHARLSSRIFSYKLALFDFKACLHLGKTNQNQMKILVWFVRLYRFY